MRLLITGGTGFIGRELCSQLLLDSCDITVLSRQSGAAARLNPTIRIIHNLSEWGPDEAFDAVINLAGEPIMDRRWTPTRKQCLFDSRVALTRTLVEAMERARIRPSVLISGSAIGIYGNQGDQILTEDQPEGTGFASELCTAWERAARDAEQMGVRTCLLRTGLVAGQDGGFLKPMLPVFRLGLGGKIGSGAQWMSWIHLRDEVGIIRHLLTHESARGAFNATAPNPITQLDLTRLLAEQLHRPAHLPAPAWLLKAGLGEMAGLLLDSQRVLPHRIQALGYSFEYPTFESALNHLLGDRSS